MRKIAVTVAVLAGMAVGTTLAAANAQPPTNGGSHLGGGKSGSCTGAKADRPADCGR